MNLDDIVGGSVNRFGQINRADYSPTPFTIENSGRIRDGYLDSGFRVGGDGHIRDGYGNLSNVGITPFGTVEGIRHY